MKDRWCEDQRKNLIEFGQRGYDSTLGGFGRLQSDGKLDRERGLETWVNCRAVYCFALDVLAGNDDSMEFVEIGAECLIGLLRDVENGGWFTGVSASGEPHTQGRKEAYTHAFVLLAASSLLAVGSSRAQDLFDSINDVLSRHFWQDQEQATLESWDRTWTTPENYRGANSNMHLTEACLAAFDVTRDMIWLRRADGITSRIVGTYAQSMGWRIPEHFKETWEVDFEYNADFPNHPFRPYGSTPGHGFEWARLVIQLSRSLRSQGIGHREWHLSAAEDLFSKAVSDGWMRDGAPGFAYTVAFDGKVLNSSHLSWVACEALSAAIVLDQEFPGSCYAEWVVHLQEYAASYLVDPRFGGWHTELDSLNNPSSLIWGDKPDFYHPFQAVLLPRVVVGPSLLGSLLNTEDEL